MQRAGRATLSTAAAAVLLAAVGVQRADAALLNGGFETVSNASPTSTGTFSDWQEVLNSAPAAGPQNAAVMHGGLTPGSTVAARILNAASASGGALVQGGLDGTPNVWQFDADFASVDPGGAADRSLDLMLVFDFNTPGAGGAHSIHLRLVDDNADGDADLQAFRRDLNPDIGTPSFAEWVTLAANLPFSVDANADGALDGVGDTLSTVHLRVNGDFGNAGGPRYTVAVGNAAPATVSYFQDGVPSAATNNIDRIAFAGNFSAGGYVVDDVQMTTVVTPEPGVMGGVLVVAGIGALRRVRWG
jgi:hypothetical protein